MHVAMHERANRRVHQTVALNSGPTAKGSTDETHAKMPAFSCTGVACMCGAVVADFERDRRKIALERGTQFRNSLNAHARCAAAPPRRESHITCATTNMKFASVKPNTLKCTQVLSLAVKATARFKKPSST